MPNLDDNLPWERQKGESNQAYQAFALYRDAGSDRSKAGVARQLQKSYTLIRRWAKAHDWEGRVVLYDKSIQRAVHEKAKERAIRLARRRVSIAAKLEAVALEALDSDRMPVLDGRTIVSMLREAARIEAEAAAYQVEATAPAEQEADKDSDLVSDWIKGVLEAENG